jgi:cell shape-determining protein MreD
VTGPRVATAAAAAVTALLLQATLVAPAAITAQLSLPAVLVAAVALEAGPGTGMCLGFATGLVADLGSSHAAGLLALCWLGLGIGCGLLADPHRSAIGQMLLAGLACTVAGALVTLGLTVVGEPGGTALGAVRAMPPSLLGNVVLAVLIVPIARRFLRSDLLNRAVVGHG